VLTEILLLHLSGLTLGDIGLTLGDIADNSSEKSSSKGEVADEESRGSRGSIQVEKSLISFLVEDVATNQSLKSIA
jgi:hypothetical protein